MTNIVIAVNKLVMEDVAKYSKSINADSKRFHIP